MKPTLEPIDFKLNYKCSIAISKKEKKMSDKIIDI